MHFSVLISGLLCGATAVAPTARQAPVYAPTSTSYAFNLIANVTDISDNFGASVHGYVLTSYHRGAVYARAVLVASFNEARVFYENGTAEEVRFGEASVISDAGTPRFPEGLVVRNATEFDYNYPMEHDVLINAGEGTKGVGLHGFPIPIPDLYAPGSGTYVACNNTIPYLHEPAITVQYAYATFTNATGGFDCQGNIPKGCVEIRLLPQCTTINELPAGSRSSHEYATEQSCYQNVSAIDWTIYSA